MAIDEALFDVFRTPKQGPINFLYPREGVGGIVRFYEFLEPTVTIGSFQKMKDFPAGTFGKGYDIVRRITGGGLVDHDESLTFAIITHKDAHAAFKTVPVFYKMIHTALFRAFLGCGIRLTMQAKKSTTGDDVKFEECFKQPVQYDLMYKGRKIVGGAQKRAQGFILHQSSIFLGIKQWQERPYLKELLRNVVINQFEESFEICVRPRVLSQEETQLGMKLEHTRYRSDAWLDKQ